MSNAYSFGFCYLWSLALAIAQSKDHLPMCLLYIQQANPGRNSKYVIALTPYAQIMQHVTSIIYLAHNEHGGINMEFGNLLLSVKWVKMTLRIRYGLKLSSSS